MIMPKFNMNSDFFNNLIDTIEAEKYNGKSKVTKVATGVDFVSEVKKNSTSKKKYGVQYYDEDEIETEDEEENIPTNNSTLESNVSTQKIVEGNAYYVDNNIQKQKNEIMLDFNYDNVKMGFIYGEILGKPKSRRRRRRF